MNQRQLAGLLILLGIATAVLNVLIIQHGLERSTELPTLRAAADSGCLREFGQVVEKLASASSGGKGDWAVFLAQIPLKEIYAADPWSSAYYPLRMCLEARSRH